MNVDNPFESPAILSFCPGILGLERGLKRAIGPLNIVAYVEIETFIIANLIAGMEAGVLGCAPVWTDVKTFDAKPFHNKVHGIIGGYPCQPFSIAGLGKGVQDTRHLFPYLRNSIHTIRPVWCFFENVAQHLNLGFDTVYKELHDLGYSVEAGIYSAAETGAPHNRERLFILAVENTTQQRMRRGHNDEKLRPGKLQTSRSSELANTRYIDGSQHEHEWKQEKHAKEFYSGSQLANPNGATTKRKFRSVSSPGKEDESQTPKRKRGRYEFGHSSEGMADTNSPRSKMQQWEKSFSEKRSTTQWAIAERGKNKWPANPGQPQHDWEHPRTIESGMGSAINGYHFREDLLRALGNSVVEYTAQIAFIDLLCKHELQHLLPITQQPK